MAHRPSLAFQMLAAFGETVSNPLDDFGATLKVILFIKAVGCEVDRVPILDEPQEGDLVKICNLQACLALGFGGSADLLGIEIDQRDHVVPVGRRQAPTRI